MGTANNRENAQDTIIYDQSGTIDPSVVGYEAAPGTTYRMLVEGNARLFIKQDEGFSTNWTDLGSGGEVNTASNLGTGTGLYKQKVGANLEFKSLRAGTNVTLSASGDEVTISSSSGASFSPAQTVFVTKNGNDVTGNGTQDNPFLTISAALTSITDASPSKRYAIQLSAGEYTEASIALKANVFIVGAGQKETTRITGAVSLDSSFSGSADNRSGFAQVILLSACDFNWNTVTSAAGKLYFNEVSFSSTINMYGYNNATAQAQFNDCVIFGAMTISGINVGVYTNCFNFNNITLNQHPNGGMASILSMAGGYCSGTVNLVTTVNDFTRRCSLFARSFWMNALTINGASSYADVTYSSLPAAGPTILNGGNIVYLNPSATGVNQQLSNLAFPTAVNQPIIPANTNATNFGDWGKQWFWSFGYVHASTGTDCYLISYPSSYAPDSSGKMVGIYADGAGLQANVNGGNIELGTAAVSGTGVRGKIVLDGREIDVTSKKITNIAAGTASTDAVNVSQLPSPTKQTITLVSGDISSQYVDIGATAKANTMLLSTDNKIYYEGEDYSLSASGAPSAPASPSISTFDYTVGSGGSFADLPTAIASGLVTNGMRLKVLNGTYTVSSTINVTKELIIYGESKTGVIFQTAATAGDPVTMFNVSSNNCSIQQMTIKHRKTSNTSVENAITVSGGGSPQTRVSNFNIDNVRIEHIEFGLVIRGSDWKIANCQFAYSGPTNSTRRHIGVYGVNGSCFIESNQSEDNGASGNTRFITPTSSTGSNPNETMTGTFVIRGNSQASGNLQQFYSQDNFQGTAGGLTLWFKNNTANETSAFVSFFGVVSGFADILQKVVIDGNSCSNLHGGTPAGGKGLISFDGTSLVSPRTSALTVQQGSNTLSNLTFRTDYTQAIGSTGSLVGYSNVNLSPVTVALGALPSGTRINFLGALATGGSRPLVIGDKLRLMYSI